jgi:hypothetical protein
MTNTKQSQPTGSGENDNRQDQSQQGEQGQDKQQAAHKAFRKEDMPDPDEDPMTEDSGAQEDAEGADEDPTKKIQIDDNPEETKRKIPYMNK